jgi:hypothetical protein
VVVVSDPANEPDEPSSVAKTADLVRRLLKVPKHEVDELRDQRAQERKEA